MNKKRKIIVLCAVAAVAVAVGFLIWHAVNRGSGGKDDKAYVEKVSVLAGNNTQINRYAGVVEPQETWSVPQNPDTVVKELLVSEGDEVKEGDLLFTYDTDKYQSDLGQAEIDLERMKNEAETIRSTIEQLEKEKKKAPASEQANYTIQIQEQQLSQKQNELNIQSKQLDIDKLKSNIDNAGVRSRIDGVIRKINRNTSEESSGGEENAFLTVMKTGDLRIKGTVNEQNISELSEGTPVIVHSRRDEATWRGKIFKIDTENGKTNGAGSLSGGTSGEETASSNYPFYVELDSSEGLMMGQHVYLEMDYGQDEKKEGLWLPEFYLDRTDETHPFVWADNGNGRLEKREVELGEYNGELMEYEIKSGLTDSDALAMPDPSFVEGMRTAPMEEQYKEQAENIEAPENMENSETGEAGELQ